MQNCNYSTAEIKILSDLAVLFRNNADKILSGEFIVSLNTRSLQLLYQGFSRLGDTEQITSQSPSTSVQPKPGSDIMLSLAFILDLIKQTKKLKIIHQGDTLQGFINIDVFSSLTYVKFVRFPLRFLRGLDRLRGRLKTISCSWCLLHLKELFYYSGADHSEGISWPQLVDVYLCYNNLQSLDDSLSLAPALRILDLSHNSIHDTANHLLPLKELQVLNLGYNLLTRVPTLSSTNLQQLILRNNNLTNLQGIEQLYALKFLDVSSNCIADHKSFQPLRTLMQLDTLLLTLNPISYHLHHRYLTVIYLHSATVSKIVVDSSPLSSRERQYYFKIRGQDVAPAIQCSPASTTDDADNERQAGRKTRRKSKKCVKRFINIPDTNEGDIDSSSSGSYYNSFLDSYQQPSPGQQEPSSELLVTDAETAVLVAPQSLPPLNQQSEVNHLPEATDMTSGSQNNECSELTRDLQPLENRSTDSATVVRENVNQVLSSTLVETEEDVNKKETSQVADDLHVSLVDDQSLVSHTTEDLTKTPRLADDVVPLSNGQSDSTVITEESTKIIEDQEALTITDPTPMGREVTDGVVEEQTAPSSELHVNDFSSNECEVYSRHNDHHSNDDDNDGQLNHVMQSSSSAKSDDGTGSEKSHHNFYSVYSINDRIFCRLVIDGRHLVVTSEQQSSTLDRLHLSGLLRVEDMEACEDATELDSCEVAEEGSLTGHDVSDRPMIRLVFDAVKKSRRERCYAMENDDQRQALMNELNSYLQAHVVMLQCLKCSEIFEEGEASSTVKTAIEGVPIQVATCPACHSDMIVETDAPKKVKVAVTASTPVGSATNSFLASLSRTFSSAFGDSTTNMTKGPRHTSSSSRLDTLGMPRKTAQISARDVRRNSVRGADTNSLDGSEEQGTICSPKTNVKFIVGSVELENPLADASNETTKVNQVAKISCSNLKVASSVQSLSPVASGSDVEWLDRVCFWHSDVTQVDHSLLKHFQKNVFQRNEELKLVLKCTVVPYPEQREFMGVLVATTSMLYVFKVNVGRSSSNLSKWLQLRHKQALTDLRYVDIGVTNESFKTESATRDSCFTFILRDKKRFRIFYRVFARLVQSTTHLPDSQLQTIGKSNAVTQASLNRLIMSLSGSGSGSAEDVTVNIPSMMQLVMCHWVPSVTDFPVAVIVLVTPDYVCLLEENFALPVPRCISDDHWSVSDDQFKVVQKREISTVASLQQQIGRRRQVVIGIKNDTNEESWSLTFETENSCQTLVECLKKRCEEKQGQALPVYLIG